jgi:hypothetical protein
MNHRRNFLQKSAALAGGGILLSAFDNQTFAILNNGIAPSDQVNIGAIGINGMGWSNVRAAMKIPGVNIVALCDVDRNVLNKRADEFAKMKPDAPKPTLYGD